MDETHNTLPRWTPDFDISSFDVQAVFREAKAQKKSAGKLLKSLGYPIAKFIALDVPTFKAAITEEEGTIPVTASTTAIDLSGDDFDIKAIDQMRAACIGTTIFLNHQYDVPEDVFGKVAEAAIDTRKVYNPLSKSDETLSCLDMQIAPVGEDENPRAVRVTNMLRKSQIRLGVSVTVLILKSKTRSDGGRTILEVFYIESSMVGIPCNQTAWATTKSLTTGVTQMNETDQRKRASFFNDEFDETTSDIYFLTSILLSGYYDLRRQVRTKALEGDAIEAALTEGLEEFKSKCVASLLPQLQAEAESGDSFDDWYFYALDLTSAARSLKSISEFRNQAQKEGRTISAENMKSIQAIHDSLADAHDKSADLGADCKCAPVEEGGEAANKSASFVSLQQKHASLEVANAELKRQLDAALLLAEKAADDLELEQAISKAAVDVLEEYGQEQLPRAGHA